MKSSPSIRPGTAHRRWVRVGSLVICFSVAILLAAAFTSRSRSGPLDSQLLTLVLMALGVAIFLHVRFVVLARREQRETAGAVRKMEEAGDESAMSIPLGHVPFNSVSRRPG